MSSGILSEIYQNPNNEIVIRQNALEVWHDLLTYSKNLKGNWRVSQEIFHTRLAPTALNRPEYFASCVEEMVVASGLKIKRRGPFTRSIRMLKNLKNKSFDTELITIALTDMLNAGLKEPLYAERAIRTSGIPVIA